MQDANLSNRLIQFLLLLGCLTGQQLMGRNFTRFPVIDPTQAYTQAHNGLKLTMQLFTHEDCKNYFGRDLILDGYRPILLHIVNKEDSRYIIEPKSIGLGLIPAETIFNKLALYPSVFLFALGTPILYYLSYKTYAFIGLTALSILFYAGKVRSELNASTLDPNKFMVIKPFESITTLLFCEEESFLTYFDMTLTNATQHKSTVIHVDLLQKKRIENPFILSLTLA